jgi:DNA-binding beta-propeller fold protein YncE
VNQPQSFFSLRGIVVRLTFSAHVDLPSHQIGGFDHADAHLESGRVYAAHTALGTVEIIDGEKDRHLATIRGCPEASGVVCAQKENLVFAASRGTGRILTIDALTNNVLREAQAGSAPNGLAWDSKHRQLLVADVQENTARLVDPHSGRLISSLQLSGRPRWCAYSAKKDQFLVNIREPSGVAVLTPEKLSQKSFLRVSVPGPHGLDIDDQNDLAYVACDAAAVVILDVSTDREIAVVSIGGGPDVIWLNRERYRLYCAIGNPGLIEVIDTHKLVVDEKVKTEEGAHTFAFDTKRQRLYAFLPKSCRMAVYKET